MHSIFGVGQVQQEPQKGDSELVSTRSNALIRLFDEQRKRGMVSDVRQHGLFSFKYTSFEQTFDYACWLYEEKTGRKFPALGSPRYPFLYGFSFECSVTGRRFYKIGISNNPRQRLRALSTQMPPVFCCEILRAFRFQNKRHACSMEASLLVAAFFAGKWLGSEWVC